MIRVLILASLLAAPAAGQEPDCTRAVEAGDAALDVIATKLDLSIPEAELWAGEAMSDGGNLVVMTELFANPELVEPAATWAFAHFCDLATPDRR